MPRWVVWALWFDFACCLLAAAWAMCSTGKARAPWPKGIALVVYVAADALVAAALWAVLQ